MPSLPPSRPKELAPIPVPVVRAPIELERLLVEQATSALERAGCGRARGVRGTSTPIPAGQLAEERESVAIRALVLLARADAFRASYPDSLLLDVVNAAVQ